MEEDLHLLTPREVQNYKDEIRNIQKASKYLENNTCMRCIPKRKHHNLRGTIALTPTDRLMRLHRKDGYGNEIYIDSSRRVWYQITEDSMCCPQNGLPCDVDDQKIKLTCYDSQIVEDSLGSSEIRAIKMSDDDLTIVSKTYNFRDPDKTNLCQHFFADILPRFLFCSKIEKTYTIV